MGKYAHLHSFLNCCKNSESRKECGHKEPEGKLLNVAILVATTSPFASEGGSSELRARISIQHQTPEGEEMSASWTW